MAEISDEQFKSEVLAFLKVANQKFDGLTSDLRSNSFKIDKLESGFDRLEQRFDGLEKKVDGLDKKVDGMASDLTIVKGQLGHIVKTVISHENRIDDLDGGASASEDGVH